MAIDIPRKPPLRTILVPTDFSAPARRALEWAVELGTRHQAKIVLVHAIPPHALADSANVDRMLHESAMQKLKEASQPIVEARLQRSTECSIGKPWVVMREAASAASADLIVIGSRGHTGFDRILLGSTADRVLRTAAQPVLTVHPTDQRPAFQHILVATNFSASAHNALATAIQLLCTTSVQTPQPARITLMHVSLPPHVIGSLEVPVTLMPDWNEIDRATHANLESLAASIRNERIAVTPEVVRGYPAGTILEEAHNRHVDAIALGTRGATGLDRLLLGSTAERVIHHANCPVLTAHARESA